MDVFAVRAYFNAHVLCFFETLLQIQPRAGTDQLHLPPPAPEERNNNNTNNNRNARDRRPRSVFSDLDASLATPRETSRDATYDDNDDADVGVPKRRQSSASKRRSLPGAQPASRLPGQGVAAESRVRHSPRSSVFPRVTVGEAAAPRGGEGAGRGVHNGGGGSGRTPSHNNNTNNNNAPASDATATANGENDSPQDPGWCQFAQLRVASSFAGKTYGDLARHLIARGAMPLGLYRPAGTKRSSLAYTHNNPEPKEALRPYPPPAAGPKGESGVSDRAGRQEVMGDGDWSVRGWEAAGDEDERRPWSAKTTPIGDEVFILRSLSCKLSGEVHLEE